MASGPRRTRRRQEIEIVITPDGNVSMETHGARGKSCLKLTQWLEEELGVYLPPSPRPRLSWWARIAASPSPESPF